MTGQAVRVPVLSEEREERRTQNWQFDRLVELGLGRGDALALVVAGVSWHDVKRLLDAGCPADLAEWILL